MDAALSPRAVAAAEPDGPPDGPAVQFTPGDEGGLVTDPAPEPGEVVENPDARWRWPISPPPAINAGERLIRLAYRLGIPGSTLAAPFRKAAKPRLLATVSNPLAAARLPGPRCAPGISWFTGSSRRSPRSTLPARRGWRRRCWNGWCIRSPGSPISRPAPRARRWLRWRSGSSAPGLPPIPSRHRGLARVRPGPSPMSARASSTGWSMRR